MTANNTNNNTSILDSAREFVHNLAKTDDQRKEDEKSPITQVEESLPKNAQEAGASVGKAIDETASQFADFVSTKASEARTAIYEATKSEEEKQKEAEEAKSLTKKVQDNVDSIQKAAQEKFEAAKASGAQAAAAIQTKLEETKEGAVGTLQAAGDKLNETKEGATGAVQAAGDKLNEAKAGVEQAVTSAQKKQDDAKEDGNN